jgi:membrane protein
MILEYNQLQMEQKVNHKVITGWNFLKYVLEAYGKHECTRHAASLAYFGIFSIFPLLLLMVYIGSFFISSESSRQVIDNYLIQIFPIASENVNRIIDQTLSARKSIGLIGGIGLLWSGSAVFNSLEISLSRIWGSKPRSFWRRRVLAVLSVFALGLVFVASIFLGPLSGWLYDTWLFPWRQVLGSVFEIVIITISLLLLYRIFPNKSVRWGPAFLGSLCSAILIVVAKFIFGIYIGIVIKNYGLVYGYLAWFLALSLWVYLLAVLILLGAELAAAMQLKKVV